MVRQGLGGPTTNTARKTTGGPHRCIALSRGKFVVRPPPQPTAPLPDNLNTLTKHVLTQHIQFLGGTYQKTWLKAQLVEELSRVLALQRSQRGWRERQKRVDQGADEYEDKYVGNSGSEGEFDDNEGPGGGKAKGKGKRRDREVRFAEGETDETPAEVIVVYDVDNPKDPLDDGDIFGALVAPAALVMDSVEAPGVANDDEEAESSTEADYVIHSQLADWQLQSELDQVVATIQRRPQQDVVISIIVGFLLVIALVVYPCLLHLEYLRKDSPWVLAVEEVKREIVRAVWSLGKFTL